MAHGYSPGNMGCCRDCARATEYAQLRPGVMALLPHDRRLRRAFARGQASYHAGVRRNPFSSHHKRTKQEKLAWHYGWNDAATAVQRSIYPANEQ